MLRQKLTVINLDQLVEAPGISYEELENKMMDNPHTIFLDNSDYLIFFKLITEQPQRAINLLEKAAEYQCGSTFPGDHAEDYLKKAMKPEKAFVKEAKQKLFKEFLDEHIHGPNLHWWVTCKFLAIVKDNPSGSLNFFQKCYEQMADNIEKDEFWNEPGDDLKKKIRKEVRNVAQALKTRNFSKSITRNKLSLELGPLELYKNYSETFIDYFSKIEDVEEKKVILRSLLECDYENKEVIDWLNNTYPQLIRDAALDPNKLKDKPMLNSLKRTFIPKTKTIRIPKKHLQSCSKLSKYFMKLEGASLSSIGFIKNFGAALIPREGNVNWEKGLYIIPYLGVGKNNYQIYKTEKHHTDEELLSRNTKESKIIKYTPGNADSQFLLLDMGVL